MSASYDARDLDLIHRNACFALLHKHVKKGSKSWALVSDLTWQLETLDDGNLNPMIKYKLDLLQGDDALEK